MDYQGMFGDLVEMWARAIDSANVCDNPQDASPFMAFAAECVEFERDIRMQMLREIA